MGTVCGKPVAECPLAVVEYGVRCWDCPAQSPPETPPVVSQDILGECLNRLRADHMSA